MEQTLDSSMLTRLVCPETRQPVRLAGAELVASLNLAAAEGRLKTHGGQMVHGAIEQVLVREDGRCAYMVLEGVPCMLIDERIDLGRL